MFSSCTNNYSPDLLPQISPHTNEFFLLQHQDLLFSHFDVPEIDPHVLQAAINLPVQSNTALGYQDLGTSVNNSFPRRKGAVKNDRHSKIFTSTGPRDRRVRLSIGIARRFFDLQDTLGFDKPSKTLDWLLTKSKTAIKDLIRTKQYHNEVFSSLFDDQCLNTKKSDDKSVKKDKDLVRVRDSRARARARARERTRAKMCSKRVVNVRPVVNPVLDFNDSVNQSQTRLSPSSSTLGNYQQNLIALSDLTANDENWDISSIIRSQTRSSAMFDQLN